MTRDQKSGSRRGSPCRLADIAASLRGLFCRLHRPGECRFRALTMNKALGLNAEQYGLAAMVFRSYVAFPFPASDPGADRRAGVDSSIMLAWGCASFMNAWVTGPAILLWIRFLLGLGEAGLLSRSCSISWDCGRRGRYRVRMLM